MAHRATLPLILWYVQILRQSYIGAVDIWDVATHILAVVIPPYFLRLLLGPEDRRSKFLRHFVKLPDCMVAYPRK